VNGAWSAWPAPAKLNLFLHVLGRRDDGYHELETMFQLLDFGDSVEVRLRSDGALVRTKGAPGVPEEQDLMLRAARRLREVHGDDRLGADLSLDKHIPMGGGLGGGSSDAATTLIALNRLWRLERSEDELAALALDLGADVPLFVRGPLRVRPGPGRTADAGVPCRSAGSWCWTPASPSPRGSCSKRRI
jgi:4-diphosphocytidyl-2-C-methyl-D-erythritol kinase